MYRNVYYSSKTGNIHLATWDSEGKRIKEEIPFRPYFYVETNQDNPDALSIFNTKLKKKDFRNSYERMKASKDGAIKRLYHNIPVEQQFLIDTFKDVYDKPEFVKNPLKICFMDLEVLSSQEFPVPKEAKHPINLITIWDTINRRFYTWGLKPYTPKKDNVTYFYYETERSLLDSFLSFWEKDYYPDILSGWSSDFFDIPYLINRISNVLGEEHVKRLSPVQSVWCREGVFVKGQQLDKWYIHGLSNIDYLEIYRTFSRQQLESYALNFVAQHELGESKLAINATNLASLSEKDWENFVDYNIQDVNLLVNLENKLQFFRIIRMLSYKGLTNFESALGKVSIVTGCIALEANKHGMVIPTFVGMTHREKIEGGFVKDPDRGLKTHVVGYDANSLYPNTIITLNISPETKIGKIIERKEDSVVLLTTNGKEYKISNEKFKRFVEIEQIAISKADVLYTQKKKGIIPSFIDGLYKERKSVKDNSNINKKLISEKAALLELIEKELHSRNRS